MTKRKSPTPDLEASISELEKIVERMEKGEQSLEESLQDFERGVALTRSCQQTLKEAEQRVEKLMQQDGEVTTEPFTPEE